MSDGELCRRFVRILQVVRRGISLQYTTNGSNQDVLPFRIRLKILCPVWIRCQPEPKIVYGDRASKHEGFCWVERYLITSYKIGHLPKRVEVGDIVYREVGEIAGYFTC